MNVKHLITASMASVLAVASIAGGAMAQSQPLRVRVSSGTPIQDPSIRFIEARENAFREAVGRNNAPVAAIFNDSQRTTSMAMGMSDGLHGIGIGENSQVARTLCAISASEVPTRQRDLADIYFHLSKVEGLLAEYDSYGSAISTTLDSTYSRDRDAVYQSLHASMETTNCVPDVVNVAIDDSEAARLSIVEPARER